MPADPTVVGYLGMKGLIDLRVADMLAKQAALQHKAALFQAHIAQHESDKAALYKNRAEMASQPLIGSLKSISPMGSSQYKIPNSSAWYEPSGESILSMGKQSAAARQPLIVQDPSMLARNTGKVAARGFSGGSMVLAYFPLRIGFRDISSFL